MYSYKLGTCKVRNEIETKPIEIKRNEMKFFQKRNVTKINENFNMAENDLLFC
jgi:hypothetical protein